MLENNTILVKSVEKILRESFKDELKNPYENRISIVKNLDIYKRVKLSYSGKGLLPEEFIAIEDNLYPRMPWEDNIVRGFATEEEASTLYLMGILVLGHAAITVRTGLKPWFSESEIENQDIHNLITIGIAGIALDAKVCDSTIENIINYIEEITDAEIINIEQEVNIY